MALNEVQRRNFAAALAVATTDAQRDRLAFAIWSESAGYIWANDGTNTSKSPGVTPTIAAILRRSLAIPHDKVGSNGRSTGMLQQLSSDVGGAWGDMAGTMDPAESARRFLARLRVTDDRLFTANLVTRVGSSTVTERVTLTLSSPIAADVLRVQQPLANEAASSNYGAGAVKIAQEISALFKPKPAQADWFTAMASNWDEARAEVQAELSKVKDYIVDGNVLNAQARAILAFDIGNGQSLGGVLAEISGAQQSILTRLAAIEAKLSQ